MPRVQVSQVTKRFGQVAALRGVDLEVAQGEIVALIGPNGSGKSTLFRILATTVTPDSGRALVAEHDVVEEPGAVRRSIGLMLGDERAWYWRLTGRQNLEFFACLYGLERRDARARASELLEQVGLTAAADRPFGGYSSGMRSRLSLARAVVNEPPVLLFDEPTRSLDARAAADFRSSVRRLVQDRGSAALFATHDLHEASELGNRVVGLLEGRLAFARGPGASADELERSLLAAPTA